MKGCLKLRSRTPSPGHSRCPTPPTPTTPGNVSKKVAFTTTVDAHDVHTADEWDRTPVEPAKPLSYEDILELKEIQNSLPRAQQRPDFYTSTRTKQYLLGVPVALLPIYADSGSGSEGSSTLSSPLPSGVSSPIRPSSPLSSSSSRTTIKTTTTPPSPTSATTPSADWSTINFRAPNKSKPNPSYSKPFIPPAPNPTPIASPWTPPHLAHLVPRSPIAPTLNSTPRPPAPQRPKPVFSFVPLVDNGASSNSRSPSSMISGSTTSAPPSPFLALNGASPSAPASVSPIGPTPRTLLGPASNHGGVTGRTPNQRIESSAPSIPTTTPTASAFSSIPPRSSSTTPSPPRRPAMSPFLSPPTSPSATTTTTATSNGRSRPTYGYAYGHHTDTDTETETETESETDPPTPAMSSRVLLGGGGGAPSKGAAVLGVDPPIHLKLHSKSVQQSMMTQPRGKSLLFGDGNGGLNPPGVLALAGPGPTRKRRVIVVNDMEIDLGEEDEQDEEEEMEDTALSEARAYNERMMRMYDY